MKVTFVSFEIKFYPLSRIFLGTSAQYSRPGTKSLAKVGLLLSISEPSDIGFTPGATEIVSQC